MCAIQTRYCLDNPLLNQESYAILTSIVPLETGLFIGGRILWIACELPCKRWFWIQILGRNGSPARQNKPSGLSTQMSYGDGLFSRDIFMVLATRRLTAKPSLAQPTTFIIPACTGKVHRGLIVFTRFLLILFKLFGSNL